MQDFVKNVQKYMLQHTGQLIKNKLSKIQQGIMLKIKTKRKEENTTKK